MCVKDTEHRCVTIEDGDIKILVREILDQDFSKRLHRHGELIPVDSIS